MSMAQTLAGLKETALEKDKERLANLDSEQRRRAIAHMNEKIKVKNMQKIYKIKGIDNKIS